MKGAGPYMIILAWFVLVQATAELDAWLSILCIDSGGEFRKEKQDDFFRGRDLCFKKRAAE